mmetsp:Transcript_129622/g.307488  ORF Transcript_129622/g.307488 Transcript_129622/m.307488 type:complete len:219 (-) Transcript_129622:185-841(-)
MSFQRKASLLSVFEALHFGSDQPVADVAVPVDMDISTSERQVDPLDVGVQQLPFRPGDVVICQVVGHLQGRPSEVHHGYWISDPLHARFEDAHEHVHREPLGGCLCIPRHGLYATVLEASMGHNVLHSLHEVLDLVHVQLLKGGRCAYGQWCHASLCVRHRCHRRIQQPFHLLLQSAGIFKQIADARFFLQKDLSPAVDVEELHGPSIEAENIQPGGG